MKILYVSSVGSIASSGWNLGMLFSCALIVRHGIGRYLGLAILRVCHWIGGRLRKWTCWLVGVMASLGSFWGGMICRGERLRSF